MLGHDLQAAFAADQVLALTRAELDVTDEVAIQSAIGNYQPDLVVHAAAYTKVDAAETDEDAAWKVNAVGSGWVARACASVGAAMIYVSSDYVFDGTLGRPYTEFDVVNPQGVYARSKEAGEQLVREALDASYIVRTSWVQGEHGANFVKTMLRLGKERHGTDNALTVVDDQTGSPTFTADLAPALRALGASGRYGTYHLTNSGSCTWFEFARAIFDQAGLKVRVEPTDTASYGAPAPRPAYSVLDNRTARLSGFAPLPDWQDSLARLVNVLQATSA